MRTRLDNTVAAALGLDPAAIADWRTRIVREPTICNTQAPIADPFLDFPMGGPSLEGLDLERDPSPMRDVESG